MNSYKCFSGVSLVAQMVKNLPANAGDMGSILGGEDTLEKEMATDSNILAWEIPWTEEQGDCERVGPNLAAKQKMFVTC